MLKNKFYATISIIGLTIGFTVGVLILIWIQDELSYDNFIEDSGQIYRVNINGKMGDNTFYAGYTPPPAGAALVDNFPEVESYTRIYRPNAGVIESKTAEGQHLFNETDIYAVDPNFLELLTYPLAKGDPKTCLQSANSIVITPQIAKKYFGNTDPMGQILYYGKDKQPLKVTGLLKDLTNLPATVKFDMLMPVQNFGDVTYFNWSWVWLNMATYVKLTSQTTEDPKTLTNLESKFPDMLKTQAASAFERIGQPYKQFLKNGNYWNIHLQPLTDIHLHSGEIVSAISDQGDIQNIYIFGLIAFSIIVLACVNFTNLATAQASRRSKEIGIRKVLGSPRSQLIKQFLTEAFLYTIISAVFAVLLVALILPLFNSLSGKTIPFHSIFSNGIWLILLGLTLLTAFLAGIYPAFYLTSFKPVNILKNSITSKKNGLLRNGLVVFQFVIAIVLVISTIIVFTQLRYTQQRDLGYDKENILVINNGEKLDAGVESFREEIAAIPQVEDATSSTGIFTKGSFGDFYVPQTTETDNMVAKDISLGSYLVDDHFISTLNLKIEQGREFDARFNDSLSVIINEAAAKQIGWENPIGQKIRYPGGNMEYYTVIGVVKDFNLESLHSSILPFALFSKSSQSYDTGVSFITLKYKTDNPKELIATIEKEWKNYQQDVPFEYSFLDDDLNAAYKTDLQQASLFGIFTALSIFVACLGLFGLVAFTAQQRTKEIGIRKILGARVTEIIKLLSMDFLRLVILAMLVASPIAWLAMNQWLQDFAYRINIPWWAFLVAGIAALGIALITVSFQAIKAAIANPVKSLRTE
ncbi:ABC transporter permease [Aequorivita lipolytica]|uniref:ABC transporter permease n=1 Tax=Aequorivita lipolytica TaxID=153267 RepID=UPI000DBBC054|nr:ABC transporter permease [Aequorivita lipolytica]SRX53050.1 Macrolide export ATP-binding/permease protein MacB [Aequorivita lipolytica]